MTAQNFIPRPWQSEVIPKVFASLDRGERPVVIACTGSGKTFVASQIAAARSPCVVVVPTERLVTQSVAGFAKFGVHAEPFYGRKKSPDADIVVCCRPSLKKLAEVRTKRSGILLDEAHQFPRTLTEALDKMDVAWLAGLTATPWTSETNKTLYLHDVAIDGCGILRGLEENCIVPWRWVHRKKDGKPVECEGGTEAIDKAVIEDLLLHAPRGKGIVTAATIADAHAFAARMTAAGLPAAGISGQDTPKQQEALLARLESGDLYYLVQSKLLGEGVDLPFVDVIAFRDELTSPVRFVQIAGRGFRTFPGKKECLLVDPRLYSLKIRLFHDAKVGAMELEEALTKARERSEPPVVPAPVVLSGPIALAETAHWLAECWQAYCLAGYPQPLHSSVWRSGHPTPTELAALRKLATPFRLSHLPAPIREPMRGLLGVAGRLSAADVSLLQTLIWSNTAWFDEGAKRKRAAGGNPFAFVHKPSLLAALPDSLPEGCLEGLAVAETLFEERRFKPWPGDPS